VLRSPDAPSVVADPAGGPGPARPPRVVIVGQGVVAEAIAARASARGWEARTAPDSAAAASALSWAGDTVTLVVLSHDADPEILVMAPAVTDDVRYLGTLGTDRPVGPATGHTAAAEHGADGVDVGPPAGRRPARRPAHELAELVCGEILAGWS